MCTYVLLTTDSSDKFAAINKNLLLNKRNGRTRIARSVVKEITGLITTPEMDYKFNNDCLIAHNEFRAKHQNTHKLGSNAKMVQSAKAYAIELAKKTSIRHSWGKGLGTNYGENLWSVWTNSTAGILPIYKNHKCRTTVKSWHDEATKFKYNYNSNGNDIEKTGHFTQLVWTTTTLVGCAKGVNVKSRSMFVVCRYQECGNEVHNTKPFHNNTILWVMSDLRIQFIQDLDITFQSKL
ncbi:unnamed protein product [Medioppia subpectinata]|uniref:SCP domain-containing protein n=1 Tax=Medioppia subpectinata TaxID=1979941 RepID=A0A7R9KUL1_9ACAR|nr:unnamed protein product [Medioppia subpectinata]CAG2108952.1 unnamed protein product [Medioppia subpectinata]